MIEPTSATSRESRLWLASKSPRRQAMLREAGIEASTFAADLDDGQLRHGDVPPEWWVMSLAYFKAHRVAEMLRSINENVGTVLGADTVCALGRTSLGQPKDPYDARRMLRLMRGREHRTITGVCLLPLHRRDFRLIVFDTSIVRLGELTDRQIDRYIESGDWRGKAGAYNLSERLSAGWPISCLGDPTTVMGLPMNRLSGWLRRAGAS